MQKQILTCPSTESNSFCMMLKSAQAGDNQALMNILDFLLPDMEQLACFIKLPREDSIQEMKTAMMEAIRRGEVWLR